LLHEADYYKKGDNAPLMLHPTHTLEKLNHFFYRGNQTFRNYFRLIIAGGGTGSVTVFAGEQLNHTNAEVVYLDFSIASMNIAQRRARSRKLSNIIWVRSWIEGVRYLGMGMFEELQCSGVLHHLKSPSLGLNILKDSLISNGKMGLMVYAKYGRTGVYQIQHMMKMINYNVYEIHEEIKNTNDTLNVLPEYNWFLANKRISDHKRGNIGIYDLLLHKRDVSYSIQTLFEWIERSGIHFIDFDYYVQRFSLKTNYAFSDHDVKRKIIKLDTAKQLHGAELLRGEVIKQEFYASKTKSNVADVLNPSNILYISGAPLGLREAIYNKKNYVVFEKQKYFTCKMSFRFIIQKQFDFRMLPSDREKGKYPVMFAFKFNSFNFFLVDRLLQSNKGVKLKTLYSEYKSTLNLSISNDELFRLTEDFYASVKDTEIFLLRNQYIAPFPKTAHLTYWQISSI